MRLASDGVVVGRSRRDSVVPGRGSTTSRCGADSAASAASWHRDQCASPRDGEGAARPSGWDRVARTSRHGAWSSRSVRDRAQRCRMVRPGIVYLEVSGPIVQLHWTVLRAVESAGAGERFEYDGESYVPHLTLGAEFAGASVEQLKAIASGARDLCGVCFTVGEVVEFHRSSATGAYIPTTRFPLGAKSGSGGAASSAPQ